MNHPPPSHAAEDGRHTLVLHVTERCNLRCRYCYLPRGGKRSSVRVVQAAVDFLLARAPARRPVTLRFFGGEPLLELDLVRAGAERLRRAADDTGHAVRLEAVSNGTCLRPEVTAELQRLGLQLMVSIDGTPETMARNRGWRWSARRFRALEDGVRAAAAAGVCRQVRATVVPGAVSLGADLDYLCALADVPLLITPASGVGWRRHQLRAVFAQIADWYIAAARGGRIMPLVTTNRLLGRIHHLHEHGAPPPAAPFCSAGESLLAADVAGDVYPCQRLVHGGEHLRLGNVFGGICADRAAPRPVHPAPHCRACPVVGVCPGWCLAGSITAGGDPAVPAAEGCRVMQEEIAAAARIHRILTAEECPAFLLFLERNAGPGPAPGRCTFQAQVVHP